MPVAHVVLVGTSIWRNLSNALSGRGLVEVAQHLEAAQLAASDVREAAAICARARPGSGEDVECGRRASGGSALMRAALEALSLSPRAVSAELNAMAPWLEACVTRRRGCPGRVYLVHSDTGAGSAAAEALRRYLAENVGLQAEAVLVEGLGKPESLASGLVRLYKTLAGLAARLQEGGWCLLLNPTGGFKVESGYALSALQSRALAAYYIHETFREVAVLPLAGLALALEGGLSRASCSGEWCTLRADSSRAQCILEALEPAGVAREAGGGLALARAIVETLTV